MHTLTWAIGGRKLWIAYKPTRIYRQSTPPKPGDPPCVPLRFYKEWAKKNLNPICTKTSAPADTSSDRPVYSLHSLRCQ